jgi:uncharacterized protein (DUF2267 family)
VHHPVKNLVMKFEKFAAEANKFLNQVVDELNRPQGEDQAYRVTRTVFHAIREILTPEESTHLIAQLPMLLKALYVDGWKIGPKNRIRSMPEFLACLRSFSDRPEVDFGNDQQAVFTVQVVLDVLQQHITTGEAADIIAQFPNELKELWQAPVSGRM